MILTFLASFCVGICQVAGPKVVATWFPPENVGTAMSFLNAGAGIGSALGFAVGGILGIKNAMLLVGILYLALLIFWLVIGGEGPYKMEMPPVHHCLQYGSDQLPAGKLLHDQFLREQGPVPGIRFGYGYRTEPVSAHRRFHYDGDPEFCEKI